MGSCRCGGKTVNVAAKKVAAKKVAPKKVKPDKNPKSPQARKLSAAATKKATAAANKSAKGCKCSGF